MTVHHRRGNNFDELVPGDIYVCTARRAELVLCASPATASSG